MRWNLLVFLIIGHFVTDINTGALPAFLPFIKESLHLTYVMTASIILVFNVTSSVIQPLFGFLSDRWSLRWLLPFGCFIAPLGLGLLGLSPSYAWILLFASLSGIGQASFHPEGFKMISRLGGTKKATVISFFHFGGNLGFAVGPFFATVLFTYFGLKGSLFFLIPGTVMLAAFLLTSEWKVAVRPGNSQVAGHHSGFPMGKTLFPMTLLLLTVSLRSATRLSLLTFVPFYFLQILHRDPLVAGKYLSFFLLAGTIGVVSGGPLADRFGYKKTVLTSFVLASLFLILFFFTEGTLSLICFTAAGLTIIFSNAVTMAIGQSLMPNNLGMASGLILGLAMGIGGIVTTILGWVADHWGVPLTLHITCLFPILAFLFFLKVPYTPTALHTPSGPSGGA